MKFTFVVVRTSERTWQIGVFEYVAKVPVFSVLTTRFNEEIDCIREAKQKQDEFSGSFRGIVVPEMALDMEQTTPIDCV